MYENIPFNIKKYVFEVFKTHADVLQIYETPYTEYTLLYTFCFIIEFMPSFNNCINELALNPIKNQITFLISQLNVEPH